MRALALLLLTFPAWAAPGLARTRASDKDFVAFQDGLALAAKVQPELFPNGIQGIDAVLYDARYLYLYSRRKDLPFREVKRWHGYHVYRLDHAGKPTAKQWGGCRGGGGSFVEKNGLRGRLHDNYFECAPLSAFVKVQRAKKGSIYTTRESYLATIVHEVAHQYQDQLSTYDRPAPLDELIAKVDSIVPGSSDLGARSIREAYAEWCELAVSEKRFREHFKNMLARLDTTSQDPHDIGMRAVREVWKEKHPAP